LKKLMADMESLQMEFKDGQEEKDVLAQEVLQWKAKAKEEGQTAAALKKKADNQLERKLESFEKKAQLQLQIKQTALLKENVRVKAKETQQDQKLTHAKEMVMYQNDLQLRAPAKERFEAKEDIRSNTKTQNVVRTWW
jgi:hypothetical protein